MFVIIFQDADGLMQAILNPDGKSMKVMSMDEMKQVSLEMMFKYQVVEVNLTVNP
ncbi:MAG TPA: hypothetical protein VFA65_24355 [Bryobacteraceae bacterium]|nr:hypothetical protein [Bryobacteraceae bacterium]